MRYCDFINQTISHKNGIDWNYYRNDIATTDIFCGEASSEFIKQYFENGEKALPLLLNPETADRFITNYFLQPAGKNLCYRIVLKSNINCLRKERYILFRGSF